MIRREDFEILAPAGTREAMAAAVRAGADAVYFGLGALDMRSLASSAFGLDDLAETAAFCRDHGVRTRLALNAVVFDEDKDEVRRVLEAAARARIDAVIASDVAVMLAAREHGLDVHLSTQLNIANTAALGFYAQFAEVAVLARELRLEQIREIARQIETEPILAPSGKPVRIEMFCHGALCMATSGRCHMSLHTRGKSANRGQCLQSCRRSYTIRDKERDIEFEINSGYVMSPKDLKTIGYFDRIVQSGARVFKIEGRARSPEYVCEAVSCYREALESVLDESFCEEKVRGWDERLSRVFNRGFWDGWYLGAETMELTSGYGSRATTTKRYVGKCLNYFSKAGVAEFQIQAAGFKPGATLLVTGPTTGAVQFEAGEIFEDGCAVNEARKETSVTVRTPEKVRENDKLYVIESRS